MSVRSILQRFGLYHDHEDEDGTVIKTTIGDDVLLRMPTRRLVVIQVYGPSRAKVIYDGEGIAPWLAGTVGVGPPPFDGHAKVKSITVEELRALARALPRTPRQPAPAAGADAED